MERIYHLRTDYNPADIGTRPSKVKDEDVGPDSTWENGHEWMKRGIEEAMEAQILTPAKDLRMQKEDKEEFDHGLVFEKFPEILVKGHSAFLTSRLDKMKARAEFSNYIIQPTKFNFRKIMRITACIFAFLRKIGFVKKSETKFRMFSAKIGGEDDGKMSKIGEEKLAEYFSEESEFAENERAFEESVASWSASICWGAEKPLTQFKGGVGVDIKDEDISMALEYWYKTGSREVTKFN